MANEITDFDFWRANNCGQLSFIEQETLKSWTEKEKAKKIGSIGDYSQASDFVNAVIKRDQRMPKFQSKIDSLIEGVRKGSKSEIKGILEKGFVPPEGMFVVRGYPKFESTVSPFENYLDKVNIETKKCTMLEIVCTLGNLTLFNYLTKTLRLRHSRDFRSNQS